MLRKYGDNNIDKTLVCGNSDFVNSLRIVNIIKVHSENLFSYLNVTTSNKELAFQLYLSGKGVRKMSRIIFNDETHISTITRWLKSAKLK